jgi:outer membrane protein assembly factor BamB
LIVVSAMLLGLVSSAAGSGGSDWPQYRFDAAHTGLNADATITTANVASLTEAWRGSGITGYNQDSPMVAGGVVYIAEYGLQAYDAAGVSNCSGSPKVCEPLWTAPTGGSAYGSPAVANGVVYTASAVDGKLYAVDAAGVSNCSGSPKVCEPLWTAPLADSSYVYSSPTVADGVVYVSWCDNTGSACAAGANNNAAKLSAFDAAGVSNCSGSPKVCTPLWTATTGNWVLSSPAVANGIVYVTSNDVHNGAEVGDLYAFDAAGVSNCSGSPKVCAPLWVAPGSGQMDASPSVAGGAVFIGETVGGVSNGQGFEAFDAASGGLLWTNPAPGFAISSPAVAGGVVYVGGRDGNLHALDAATGFSLWTAPGLSWTVSSPAVAGGVVYIAGCLDGLCAFDAAGVSNCSGSPKVCAPLWAETPATGEQFLDSSPAVAGGFVYINSSSGQLFAYSLPAAGNQAPTDIALSATSVPENQPAGTTVGNLSTTDPDSGDSFTYTLVPGIGDTDNVAFTIAGDSLKTAASFDYETKNSYTIRVRSTDSGGLFFEKQFTISVTNVNEGPGCSGVTATPSAISPTAHGMQLITLSGATDPDGDTLGYQIDGVTQDEPVTGMGDRTSPDAALTSAGASSNQVFIRAEASSKGNGRVYRIAYTVSDGNGGSCSGTAGPSGNTTAKVGVPRSKKAAAVDNGNATSWNSFTGAPVP